MKRLKYGVITLLAIILMAVSIWWIISEAKEKEAEMNQPDIFLFHDQGELHWFELTIQKDKIIGKLHQQIIIEEPGQVPLLEEKISLLNGEKNGNGYDLFLQNDKEKTNYYAKFKEGNLFVQLQGEREGRIYKATNEEELQSSIRGLQDEFDLVMYHMEYKENERIRNFFNDFKNAYGFLSTKEDESLQLFIKIDEALLEGEVTGTLLMMTKTDNSYKESTYELNGITDGLMIQFHTIVDGKETKLEGNFREGDSLSFALSFWESNKKLLFQEVTEEEFQQRYEEYKTY